jgi:hypothetical protein
LKNGSVGEQQSLLLEVEIDCISYHFNKN